MTEYWEQWCGSTVRPVEQLKRGAKVTDREERVGPGVVVRRRWISYRDEIDGTQVVVEMPENAPTKSCFEARHDACPHRLGGPQEGGVTLKLGLPGFTWRCGCDCHRDPFKAGRLF
jgi:hypothetical protein